MKTISINTMKTEPNDAAHPFATEQTLKGFQGTQCGQMGLTKRELLAAIIMGGFMSQDDPRTYSKNETETYEQWRAKILENDAKYCVLQADALIAALNAEQKK